jgi:hypothetical protein
MFNVIPGLQEYITRQGTLELSANNRLVMLTKDEIDLIDTLQVMQAELSVVTGNPFQIQVDGEAQPGDIVCAITSEIKGHPQGYTIEIDRNIKIKASTSTGIFTGYKPYGKYYWKNLSTYQNASSVIIPVTSSAALCWMPVGNIGP